MIASAPSPGAAGSTPFAGRESELTVLDRAVEAAVLGEPRAVVVEGRAGMGKSALLGEFARRLPDGSLVVRVSGGEPEAGLPHWLMGQLLTGVGAPGSVSARRAAGSVKDDPLTAGAELAGALSQAMAGGRLVVLIIDDLHWADPESAAAILHALRRMQAGTLVARAAARPRELEMLGGGSWSRFAAGDHRATRLCLGGLGIPDVHALARAVGLVGLSDHSAARLVESTAGRPGYCWAILDEAGRRSGGSSLFKPLTGELAWVSQDIVEKIEGRAGALCPEARGLLEAAAVLGFSSSLACAAEIAGLADPSEALAEVAETGLLSESWPGRSGGEVQFADPVSQLVIYRQVGLARRRELHRRAVEVVSPEQRLRHRFGAAAGADSRLAAEFERAGRRLSGDAGSGGDAAWYGSVAAAGELDEPGEPGGEGLAAADQAMAGGVIGGVTAARTAAVWLAHAAALVADRDDRERLLLDAGELLLRCGEAAAGAELAVMITQAVSSPRRDALLGWLDLLNGRFAQAEVRLVAARRAGRANLDSASYAYATIGLLWCRLHAGRIDEAVSFGRQVIGTALTAGPVGEPGQARSHTDVHRGHESIGDEGEKRWSGRAVTWADGAGDWAIALACARRGSEAMACFGSLPAGAGEVPMGATGMLAARGIVRVIDGAFEAAVTDLSVVAGRLESGCAVRLGGLAMGFLAEAEYQLGDWNSAAQHASMALRLTDESGRTGELSLVHAFGALVPVGRGDWEAAAGHVEAAGKAARGTGTVLGIAAWASARAELALARGDGEEALRAVQAVKDTGREEELSRLGFCSWPLLEAEALIDLGRTAEARARLKDSIYAEPQVLGLLDREPVATGRDSLSDYGLAGPGLSDLLDNGRNAGNPTGMAHYELDASGVNGLADGETDAPAVGGPSDGETDAPGVGGPFDGEADGWGSTSLSGFALDALGVSGLRDDGPGAPGPTGLSGYVPDAGRVANGSGTDWPAGSRPGAGLGSGSGTEQLGTRLGRVRVSEELVALRLHGLLAAGDGDAARVSAIFAAGRGDPRAGVVPYRLAQLEVAAGRGLRLLGQRPEAIGWLREARGRLVRLGAAPAIGACDQELAACGVQTGREVSAATLGLTPTELAVASLVAAGRSNRQAAAELYISIKGIEFHLRNIFAKLGIRSRKDLADRLGDDADVMTLA